MVCISLCFNSISFDIFTQHVLQLLAVVYNTFTDVEKEKFKRLYLHKRLGASMAFRRLCSRKVMCMDYILIIMEVIIKVTSYGGLLFGIHNSCLLSSVSASHQCFSVSSFVFYQKQNMLIEVISWCVGICTFPANWNMPKCLHQEKM